MTFPDEPSQAPGPRPGNDAVRRVSASIESSVATDSDIVVAVAVAHGVIADESFVVTLDGAPIEPIWIESPHGGRLHLLSDVPAGWLRIDYRATSTGFATPAPVTDADRYHYLRPSRYCESDHLGPTARAEFAGLEGHELLDAVSSWVGTNVVYVPGSSRPTDGAVSTMLSRSGVCRDFTHLAVALLRANGMPARVVSVYAPGLEPMDFHAVVEARIGDAWYVVDPTALAPRDSMVRIATGVDATDIAFLTTLRGSVELHRLAVTAIVEPWLPVDDLTRLVQLR